MKMKEQNGKNKEREGDQRGLGLQMASETPQAMDLIAWSTPTALLHIPSSRDKGERKNSQGCTLNFLSLASSRGQGDCGWLWMVNPFSSQG